MVPPAPTVPPTPLQCVGMVSWDHGGMGMVVKLLRRKSYLYIDTNDDVCATYEGIMNDATVPI